jgi:hypothetical protein
MNRIETGNPVGPRCAATLCVENNPTRGISMIGRNRDGSRPARWAKEASGRKRSIARRSTTNLDIGSRCRLGREDLL